MKSLKRLIQFLGPHRREVLAALTLSLAAIAANIGLLAIAGYLIAAAALRPLLETLVFPMYAVRVLGVSRALLRYGERLVSHRVTLTMLADLRVWMFSRLEPLAPATLSKRRSGDLLARLTGDLDELQNIYLRILSPVVVATVALGITATVFALFSPRLALTAALFLIAAGVGAPVLALSLARGLGERQLALHATLHDSIVEAIQGMPDLLAFNRTQAQTATLAKLEQENGRLQGRQARIMGIQGALGDLASNAAVVVILALAIPLVGGGQIAAVYLGFLVLLMLASFEAVQPLGVAFGTLGRGVAATRRLFEVADATPIIRDPALPVPVPVRPALRFENVRFAYDQEDGLVLDGVSFTVCPGQWVAVVGPSGAGKSTLANLALRLWDPDSGTVCMGDHAVADYRLEDLRGSIALVSQDTTLFTDTLRNNLRLARPEATDADLIDVLATAQLSDLLERLPGGLDGWLGEQGLTLSGGERQRLAVARALLKDAPIIILDEATASLDPQTEDRLLAAVHDHTQGRAVLVITHRLIGMDRLSEILVLNGGRVAERGCHDQLKVGNGLYRQMLDAQQQLLALA